MQFKLDENIPVEIADVFRNSGFDAKTVNEQNISGIQDSDLIDVCNKKQRVLVTLDTDFSDIRAYPPQEFWGIIVLRVKNQNRYNIVKVINSLLPKIIKEPLKHHLWIVEEARVRIRSK